jgi:MYXO-CTERM domain-containing protein
MSTERITREQIEESLRKFLPSVGADGLASKGADLGIVVVALLLLLAVAAYFVGRRRGHKRTTIVEVRRV